jgi:hypothetical protein
MSATHNSCIPDTYSHLAQQPRRRRFCIDFRGVYSSAAYLPAYSSNMSWQAKSGCAKHHRAAVERIVNAFPPSYLLPPCSGEIFENLDECTSRLRGYSVAKGFDVIR